MFQSPAGAADAGGGRQPGWGSGRGWGWEQGAGRGRPADRGAQPPPQSPATSPRRTPRHRDPNIRVTAPGKVRRESLTSFHLMTGAPTVFRKRVVGSGLSNRAERVVSCRPELRYCELTRIVFYCPVTVNDTRLSLSHSAPSSDFLDLR